MLYILIAPLLVLLILFGLSNRQEVSMQLWPFDLAWVAPLSVAIMIAACLAFLFGASIVWLATMKYRRRIRLLEDAHRKLSREAAELRGRLAREVGPQAVAPAGKAPGTSVVTVRSAA